MAGVEPCKFATETSHVHFRFPARRKIKSRKIFLPGSIDPPNAKGKLPAHQQRFSFVISSRRIERFKNLNARRELNRLSIDLDFQNNQNQILGGFLLAIRKHKQSQKSSQPGKRKMANFVAFNTTDKKKRKCMRPITQVTRQETIELLLTIKTAAISRLSWHATIVRVIRLVVHYQLIIDEIKTVRMRLEWIDNHFLN